MEAIGSALAVVGAIIIIYGSILFLIAAFQESILWGLGCIIIPFISIFFLLMHWGSAGRPFMIQLAGLVPVILGGLLMGS